MEMAKAMAMEVVAEKAKASMPVEVAAEVVKALATEAVVVPEEETASEVELESVLEVRDLVEVVMEVAALKLKVLVVARITHHLVDTMDLVKDKEVEVVVAVMVEELVVEVVEAVFQTIAMKKIKTMMVTAYALLVAMSLEEVAVEQVTGALTMTVM